MKKIYEMGNKEFSGVDEFEKWFEQTLDRKTGEDLPRWHSNILNSVHEACKSIEMTESDKLLINVNLANTEAWPHVSISIISSSSQLLDKICIPVNKEIMTRFRTVCYFYSENR